MKNYKKKENRFRSTAIKLSGIIPVFLGVSALIGWILNIPLLTTIFAGKIPMAPSTAALFILFGLIMNLSLTSNRIIQRIRIILGSTGILVSLLLLFVSLKGIQSDAESLGFNISGMVEGVNVGHISPISAFGFVLIGLSILIMLISGERKKPVIFTFSISVLIIFISTIFSVSYLLGAPLFYGLNFIPPAFTTSLAFLFISISVMLSVLSVWINEEFYDKNSKSFVVILVLSFVIFSIGIIFEGIQNYKRYERHLRTEIENELTAIAELKVGEIVQWRKERIGDAAMFYGNKDFSKKIKSYLEIQNSLNAKDEIINWMKMTKDSYGYNRLCFHDIKGIERLSYPEGIINTDSTFKSKSDEVIKAKRVDILDLYKNKQDSLVYLHILVPVISDDKDSSVLGILAMRINPEIYLYPFISKWPTPSRTSETLILRREGGEAVFLNNLKFQKNTFLDFRISMERKEVLGVKALLGETGIVDGIDYRGEEVIGYVCQIPNSPWFMVARMDKAEVYAPLKERLQIMLVLVFAFIFGSGTGIGLLWRNQRAGYYKERSKSNEALRKSEERFRLLYERSPVPYQSLDIEGKLIEVNNAFIDLFGYPYQEVIGHHISEFLVTEDIQLLQERFPKFKKSGELHDAEFRFKCKDGNVITVSVNGKIGFDINGEFSQTHCVLHNITERKRVEKVLQDNEAKLSAILESTSEGILAIDSNGKMIRSNKRFADLWRIPQNILDKGEDNILLNFVLEQLVNPEEFISKVRDLYQSTDEDSDILNFKDGRIFERFSTPLLLSDSSLGRVWSFSDITEKKKAEDEIIKLNRVYRVLSNVNQMIVRTTKVDEILKESCNIAVTDGEFLSSWIGYVNKETNKVTVLSYAGIGKEYLENINIDFNDRKQSGGPTGMAIKSSTHIVSNDIEHDEKMIPWREDALKAGYKSSIALPIKVFGKIVYVYNLYSGEVNFFDEDEVKLLDELVMDVSFALEFIEREKERMLMEESLKESEQKYKDIFFYAPVGIYQSSREGKILHANTRFIEILGYRSIEELMSVDMHKDIYYNKAEREKLISEYESIGEVENLEVKWKKKDGTPIWISLSSHVFHKDDDKVYFEGFVRDITDKKHDEELLIASEEKYRNLIETMPEGFYRSTPEGYFVDVNPAFIKMFGYDSKEEIMKAYIPETFYYSKEERDEGERENVDFMPETDIYRLKKKDGSEIWIEDYARYIRDASGKLVFHEGIMRDITESLRAQKAILEAKDKAEEMSRLKSSFLANMSHEIRTPLNGILGFAEILKSDIKDDEQLNCVEVIEKGGRRLLETLDLILNYSKLEAEMITALYSEVNVSKVINEVVKNFEAMAKNKNLFIKKDIKYINLAANIDERFLRHSLNNLIKNAIVYTNEGGLTVTFDKDENDMIIKVKDTGMGIARENFDIIFEPFRQESEGWGRNFEGTGLGLSITKRFVEMMKGNIEVESEVGVGSTFTIKLPFIEYAEITNVENINEKPEKETPVIKSSKKKELSILLVENDEDNMLYTSAILSKHYFTDTAIDGYEAIEKAMKKAYDIVLMDINLGKDIDGIMATQKIRELKGHEKTPIVALTAYAREGDKEEFLAGGCTHYLGKPFTVKQLLDLIDDIVEGI